jgi:uncharacterized cupin superfamily protein
VVPEASLRETEHGLVPEGEGWFVVSAREARWWENELGGYCGFEGQPRFSQLGINLNVLPPGMPMAMYHRENDQEDFLVLAGEAVLVIENEERPLKAWDFVHCPGGTDHVIVGTGDRPCLVLAVGARTGAGGLVYPESEAAQRHGAGVERETSDPKEAYARFSRITETRCREDWLPELY